MAQLRAKSQNCGFVSGMPKIQLRMLPSISGSPACQNGKQNRLNSAIVIGTQFFGPGR